MDLQDMRIFKTVADVGSFLTASRVLNYAQSGVSTRMQRLENEFNVQLFYRTNRGIDLTKKGELLYNQVCDILMKTDQLTASMSEEDMASGTLKLGSLQTVAETTLPILLSDYHKKYPNVEIQIHVGITASLTNAVLERRIDAAIIGEPCSHPDLISLPYANECAKIATSSGEAPIQSIQDLSDKTLLVFPYGCSYRKLLEQVLTNESITPAHIIEITSIGAVIAGISAGMGISLLPASILDRYVEGRSLRTYDLPEKYSNVYLTLIQRKDLVITKAMKEFQKAVQRVTDEPTDGCLSSNPCEFTK